MVEGTPLSRALRLAIDAGQIAAADTRQVALVNTDPADRGTVLMRFLPGRLAAKRGPGVSGAQLRRACDVLDDYSAALRVLNDELESPDDHVDTLEGLSATLWDSSETASDVHNQVNDILAWLGRYRTNLILSRPLRSGE